MKTTVLIVAQNEEQHIKQCLNSVISQSLVPDEIILVAHNCTDRTIAIAKSYPNIKIDDYQGPEGIIYARMRAFNLAANEYIACIDGDSIAHTDWLKNIIEPLQDSTIAGVGGLVKFIGSVWSKLVVLDFFYIGKFYRPTYHFYFWGANFSCRKSDYITCGGLEPLIELQSNLKLNYSADDCFLSLLLNKLGKIKFQPKAVVHSYEDEKNRFSVLSSRGRLHDQDRIKLFNYFGIIKN